MDKTVGIVGLGIMGGAIARNLVERGWRVIGFDSDAARCRELAQAHVEIAGDVAQVASDAPIIMTSLPSPAAVEDVAQSNGGGREGPSHTLPFRVSSGRAAMPVARIATVTYGLTRAGLSHPVIGSCLSALEFRHAAGQPAGRPAG